MTATPRSGDSRTGDPDPYPNYAWLREHAPVSAVYSPHGVGTTWMVTSYDLARAALGDPRLSNDDRTRDETGPAAAEQEGRGLLGLDRPEHARLRGVLNAAFTSRAVRDWQPMIERACHRALDAVAHAGRADLVPDFALPVPVEIIHQVLGVPRAASGDARTCFDLFFRAGLTAGGDDAALAELTAYVDGLIDYKRANPGDDIGTLLLRARAAGTIENDGELHAMVLGLVGAGHVSTTQFFGCALLRLLGQPAELARITDPAFDWTAGIDELLRVDPPFQAAEYRYATEDLRLGEHRIARGDAVIISLAAANRDPARFGQPDVLDLGRSYRSNLAFGHGPHLCLGMHLARLEARVGLLAVLSRLPRLRLEIEPADVVWQYGPLLRGPRSVPVSFTPDP